MSLGHTEIQVWNAIGVGVFVISETQVWNANDIRVFMTIAPSRLFYRKLHILLFQI
jgi:hypothetical protein